jgi:hypothetical protein
MILSCKEAARLMSQQLERELPFGRRVMLRAHLAICAGCTNFGRQMSFLRKAVGQLGSRER